MCRKGCPDLHDIRNENGGLGFFLSMEGGNGPASYIDFKGALLRMYNQLLSEPPRLWQVIVTSQARIIFNCPLMQNVSTLQCYLRRKESSRAHGTSCLIKLSQEISDFNQHDFTFPSYLESYLGYTDSYSCQCPSVSILKYHQASALKLYGFISVWLYLLIPSLFCLHQQFNWTREKQAFKQTEPNSLKWRFPCFCLLMFLWQMN